MLVLSKRILVGYLVLFAWVIAGVTFGLPFSLTLAVGVGLISPQGNPFPPETFQWVLGFSIALSMLTGLWWYALPQWWIGAALEGIRLRLEKSASRARQKAVGMLALIHLCAFVLSPLALFWWVLARLLRDWTGVVVQTRNADGNLRRRLAVARSDFGQTAPPLAESPVPGEGGPALSNDPD